MFHEGRRGVLPCPLNEVMDILGSRWTLSVVVTIGNLGRLRFHELEERLRGISAKTLSRRFRTLGRMGLIERESYAEDPPRIDYSLTDEGTRRRDASVPPTLWATEHES